MITNKLFDDKIPTIDEFRYEGTKGGDAWRRKVRNYWLSKAPQLMGILNWTEHSEEPIENGDLMALVGSNTNSFRSGRP